MALTPDRRIDLHAQKPAEPLMVIDGMCQHPLSVSRAPSWPWSCSEIPPGAHARRRQAAADNAAEKGQTLMMGSIVTRVAGALLCAAVAAAPARAADKLKVGFVYVGPVADYGYSYQHDLSRKALAEALPDKVETTFLENVPEADSER